MAVPAYLLDTNILLRLALPGGPYDEVVVSAVGRLIAESTTLYYTLQNAAEFWNVRTRPRDRNGLGFTLQQADRRLQLIERQFLLLPEKEATYVQWRRIVIDSGVSGVQVHDARLAALMSVSNVTHLLTLNPGDFERFTGLTATHPKEVQSPRPNSDATST
jgi:predicted nucleic acid-binding protein